MKSLISSDPRNPLNEFNQFHKNTFEYTSKSDHVNAFIVLKGQLLLRQRPAIDVYNDD